MSLLSFTYLILTCFSKCRSKNFSLRMNKFAFSFGRRNFLVPTSWILWFTRKQLVPQVLSININLTRAKLSYIPRTSLVYWKRFLFKVRQTCERIWIYIWKQDWMKSVYMKENLRRWQYYLNMVYYSWQRIRKK